MRAKLVLLLVVVAAIGGAYLAGAWPEREQRLAAEATAETLRSDLAAAEARVRAGRLLGRLLTVEEAVVQQNYGQALELSSRFFDEMRAEEAQAPESDLRTALARLLNRRDAITAALAKADPGVAGTLREIQVDLRRALDYPVLPAVLQGEPLVIPPEPASPPSQ